MKKRNIAYWVVTALFSAFMIFSAVPDIMMVPDAMKFIGHLGYPDYFIPFIGVAKLLGSIAILIPGFPRIKEWAYAGLFLIWWELFIQSSEQMGLTSPCSLWFYPSDCCLLHTSCITIDWIATTILSEKMKIWNHLS